MNPAQELPAIRARGTARLLELAVLILAVGVLLALIVKLCGADPQAAFAALFRGAFGSAVAWGDTLKRTAVLAFLGLAVALSFRAGLFNIGADGQFIVGAMAAAALGVRILPAEVPGFLGVGALCFVGALAGAGWSLVAGIWKRWRGVSEVIVSLMLNFLALVLLKYLVGYPELLRDPASIEKRSALFPLGAQLPGWGETSFHAGIFLVVPVVLALHALVFHMRAGLSLRATGLNPIAARACGIPVERVRLLVFGASGALAGWAGAMAVMADGRLTQNPPFPEYGFMALAVALVAGLYPLAVLPAAFGFAALEAGAKAMERSANVPSDVVYLVEGVVILALLSRNLRLPGSAEAEG